MKKFLPPIVFRRAAHEFGRNKSSDIAASMTYYAVLAVFPGLLAMVSLLSLILQGTHVTGTLLATFRQSAPQTLVDALTGPLTAIAETPSAGLGLIVGIAGALWSTSGYVAAFSRGMNHIYKVEEGRSTLRLQATVLAITTICVVLFSTMAAIFVLSSPFATWIGNIFGIPETAFLVWKILEWPVLLLFSVVIVAVLYAFTPNVRNKFRFITVGSVAAIVGWILATVVFFFYVSNFANYNAVYGSLGGVIAFLLWGYLTNLVLLFGAELDVEMERIRQLRAGIPAEYHITLTLRGTRAITRNCEAMTRDVKEARALRKVWSTLRSPTKPPPL